jgi:hypothetical protein
MTNQDLLLVGYSGSEDLDLVSALADTLTERSIVWTDHQARGEPPRLSTAAAALANPNAVTYRNSGGDTGYRLNLWSHFLRAFSIGSGEDDYRRKVLVIQENHEMLRVAVDVGDVAGEVETRFLLGIVYYAICEFARATEQLVCVLELGRIVNLGDKTGARGN